MPFSLTTEPSTFIRSLIQNLNIPYKFSYGVMVAFRFIPMIETEFNVVRSAHKVMGFSDDKGIFLILIRLKDILFHSLLILSDLVEELLYLWIVERLELLKIVHISKH